MIKISRTRAINQILNNKGRFITVTFRKKSDSTIRTMNGNKIRQTTIGNIQLKTKDGYRQFRPHSLIEFKANKQHYKIG